MIFGLKRLVTTALDKSVRTAERAGEKEKWGNKGRGRRKEEEQEGDTKEEKEKEEERENG